MSGSGPLNLLEELNRLETLRSPTPGGHRRHLRFLIRNDAELHPMNPQQLDRTPLEIKLRDISRCGVGFICQTPLPQGSTWRACFIHRGHVIGHQGLMIRHCRNVGDGLYLIGGQFCVDTGLLVTLGIEPSRVYEGDNQHGHETNEDSDAFSAPDDIT